MGRIEILYKIMVGTLLVGLNIQLFLLNREVQHVRTEQVKNRVYSLPKKVRERLDGKQRDERTQEQLRSLESSSFVEVQGSVDVSGEVQIQGQPVEVTIAP